MSEVVAVCINPRHGFSKPPALAIKLIKNHGVEGDAHAGVTVKHRSRARIDPNQPNLRQVHLIHAELIDELNAAGFDVAPGLMGENVTTRGIDLLGLGAGTRLRLGDDAIIEVTGLRNPCSQLDKLRPGLMKATLGRAPDGALIRKCGIMGVVIEGGEVMPGAPILVSPPNEHRPLAPV
jgi:MOSC domain-containing protein YiiM